MGLSDENTKALRDLMPELAAGLVRYAEHGIETGGFLRACLEFDLAQAYARADATNRERVPAIFDWISRNMPEGSFGSKNDVTWWIDTMREQRHAKIKDNRLADMLAGQAAAFQNTDRYINKRNAITSNSKYPSEAEKIILNEIDEQNILDLKAEQRREWESGLL